jgi:polyhydroxyalkanoate synthesis regulator phasin
MGISASNMVGRQYPRRVADNQSGIGEALRRYIDAAVGFTEVPRQQAERIVRDLAERGEGRARDLQRSARELADRSARNRKELMGLINKEIRRQISALGLATKADVEKLNRRVRDLEKPKGAKRSPGKAAKPKGTKSS